MLYEALYFQSVDGKRKACRSKYMYIFGEHMIRGFLGIISNYAQEDAHELETTVPYG